MLNRLCRWLLYSCMGWTKVVTVDHPDKYIICLAPHTSNWDFIIGLLYMHAEGMKSNFLMKKEWFVGPLKPLLKAMGGIPVWRSKHTSMTDNLAAFAQKEKTFQLCITPEGTRSLNPDWKMGFYYIALKANIPILLYGLDYQRKTIKCTKKIIPTGNVDEQMKEVKLYFKGMQGKHPEKFSIGEIAQ